MTKTTLTTNSANTATSHNSTSTNSTSSCSSTGTHTNPQSRNTNGPRKKSPSKPAAVDEDLPDPGTDTAQTADLDQAMAACHINPQSRSVNGSGKKSPADPGAVDEDQPDLGVVVVAQGADIDPDSTQVQGIAAVPSRKRLYVSNLKWQVSEERLRQEFGKFGLVTEVRVVRDRRSGWSRGFGFVSFGSSDAASEAMETLNGTELEGRLVRIEFARSSGPSHRPHLYDDDGSGRVPDADGPASSSSAEAAHDGGLQYGGLDPGYCMSLPHGVYTAYIPGQYCDPHTMSYQYIPSGYWVVPESPPGNN